MCFVLATLLVIRTIVIASLIGSSIVIIIIEIIMSILCIAIGILTLSLKGNLAKNAPLLKRWVSIGSLVWFILGALCAVFTILNLVNASFNRTGQMMGALFSWFVILFIGLMFFRIFSAILNIYIRASNSEQSGQNERMVDDYPYVYAQPGFSNQPMPNPQFINPSPIVIEQPLYFPPAGNASNQMFGNGMTQYKNPYSPPPQNPPTYY